ncbi:MAG: hypothetical protein HC872_00870 [Gammaproteobacteria bacterium]|nr:hypothetical protein [Gammaproteobacteria bacterium]
MLLQMAAATVAGALFFLRDLRLKLRSWISRNRPRDNSDERTEPSE